MSLNTIYLVVNFVALGGWAMLLASVFLGNRLVTVGVVRALVMALAAVYVVTMLWILPFKGGGFASLDGLAGFFSQPQIVLAGWIHYLVMDLFIGTWQLQIARSQQLPNMLVVPTLLLTMLFGPLGLLVFLSARHVICLLYTSDAADE